MRAENAPTPPSEVQAFAVGVVVPGAVVRPNDTTELAAVVAEVAAERRALVTLGAGAHRSLGYPPRRFDVALVTERLARLSDYAPADMTVTAEAGVRIADLQAALAREHQWLPLEPPLPAETTVGGLIAADLSGVLAASEGRVRDFVIGIGVVTAAGVTARAGGRVVKNVAGYDLMKLFIGSLGTLAVVTEATFKVRPLPEERRLLVWACADVATAMAFAAGAATPRIGARAVTLIVEGEPCSTPLVVVRLAGTAADVAVARARLAASAPAQVEGRLDVSEDEGAAAIWVTRVRDHLRHPADLVVRLPAVPTRGGALVPAALEAVATGRGSLHHDVLGGGTTLALATDDPAGALVALTAVATSVGARLVVERWPDALADTVEVWRPLPSAFPMMERVKAALDPYGTLSPGRFVGRL